MKKIFARKVLKVPRNKCLLFIISTQNLGKTYDKYLALRCPCARCTYIRIEARVIFLHFTLPERVHRHSKNCYGSCYTASGALFPRPLYVSVVILHLPIYFFAFEYFFSIPLSWILLDWNQNPCLKSWVIKNRIRIRPGIPQDWKKLRKIR